MTGFSRYRRDGDQVIKLLDMVHPVCERVAAAARDGGRPGLRRYLEILRAHDVALSSDLMVLSGESAGWAHGCQPLGIRQTAVTLAPDYIERKFQYWNLLLLDVELIKIDPIINRVSQGTFSSVG